MYYPDKTNINIYIYLKMHINTCIHKHNRFYKNQNNFSRIYIQHSFSHNMVWTHLFLIFVSIVSVWWKYNIMMCYCVSLSNPIFKAWYQFGGIISSRHWKNTTNQCLNYCCFFSRVNEAMGKILIMQVYFKIYHAYNVYIMNGDKH